MHNHIKLSKFISISAARDAHIFTILEEIKQEQSALRKMMQVLLRRQAPVDEPSMPDGIIPLDSMESVNAMEQTLSDGNHGRQLVSCFLNYTCNSYFGLYSGHTYACN